MDVRWNDSVSPGIAAASFFAFVAMRRNEAQLVTALSNQWLTYGDGWQKLILMARGPHAHYINARPETVRLYDERLQELVTAFSGGDTGVGVDAQVVLRGDFLKPVKEVVSFLSLVPLLVMKGRLSPSSAYTALGSDIPRNSRAILSALRKGYSPPQWNGPHLPWGSNNSSPADYALLLLHSWADAHPGLVERVFAARRPPLGRIRKTWRYRSG